MFTSNPTMLPDGVLALEFTRCGYISDPEARWQMRAVSPGEPLKTLIRNPLSIQDDGAWIIDPCVAGFEAFLRQHFLVEFGSMTINETKMTASLRHAITVRKEMTMQDSLRSKLVLDLVAIPSGVDPEYDYSLYSAAALVPFVENELRERRNEPRAYAKVGVTSAHIDTVDRGLAICQWLVMQGYGIISLTSDGDTERPFYRIVVKTPWADNRLTQLGY